MTVRMQRYSAWKRIVLDANGSMVCTCRDAATARLIRDVLNAAEDAQRREASERYTAKLEKRVGRPTARQRSRAEALAQRVAARRGPGGVMIRPHRMKGVNVQWPNAPLTDGPRTFVPRAKLRGQFGRSLAPLKRLGAVKKLRGVMLAGARSAQTHPLDDAYFKGLRRRVKKSSQRKRWLRGNRAAFADYNERIATHGLFYELQPPPDAKKLRAAIKAPARLRRRLVADAAAAEREMRKTGMAHDAGEVFDYLKARGEGRRARRPRGKRIRYK